MKKLLIILLCLPIIGFDLGFKKSYKKQIVDGDIQKERVEYFDEETEYEL